MRRLSNFLFLPLLFVLFPANLKAQQNANPTPVSVHGALSVSGTKIVDQNGNVVSFAGNSFFWSNTYWDAEEFYNAEVVKWLQDDWGSTIVRVAMGVDEVNGYLDRPEENLNRIKTVVDAAIANGMYVIIDWHSHHAENYQPEAIAFFQQMAREYGDNPNVIYEIYNEPIHVSWSDTVKPYAQAVISAIREIDPDNMIIVGTPTWSQDVDIASLDPIQGVNNIAYTLHFYAATHGETLRQKAQTAINNGLPLFVTEWGTVEASADGLVDHLETDRWISFLETNHISHCNWSVNDKVEGASIVFSGANPLGGWSETDLTESGLKAKEIIGSWPQYAPAISTAYPNGIPHAIPGLIDPTHFNSGGLGVAYYDTTPGNLGEGIRQDEDVDGGFGTIGWIEEGEWMEFTVDVQTAGRYVVSYEVASLYDGAFRLEFDGQDKTGTVEVQSTGGWVTFETISSTVNLEAGEQKMRVVMGEGTFNLSNINFSLEENDLVPPDVTINSVAVINSSPSHDFVRIEGSSTDNVSVDRNRLMIYDTNQKLYWNGFAWQSRNVWFSPDTELNNWSYTLDLRTWDSSSNISERATREFTGPSDEVSPVIEINSASLTPDSNSVTISGSSTDNILVDRNNLMIYDASRKLHWDGKAWKSGARRFSVDTDLNNWSYTLDRSTWRWNLLGDRLDVGCIQ